MTPITEATLKMLEENGHRPSITVRDHNTGKAFRYPYIAVREEDVEGTTLVRVEYELSEVGEEITQNA